MARRVFFASTLYPGWRMGKYGVVYRADRVDELLGFGTCLDLADLVLTDNVQHEARAAGYFTTGYGERAVWHKPSAKKPPDQFSEDT